MNSAIYQSQDNRGNPIHNPTFHIISNNVFRSDRLNVGSEWLYVRDDVIAVRHSTDDRKSIADQQSERKTIRKRAQTIENIIKIWPNSIKWRDFNLSIVPCCRKFIRQTLTAVNALTSIRQEQPVDYVVDVERMLSVRPSQPISR